MKHKVGRDVVDLQTRRTDFQYIQMKTKLHTSGSPIRSISASDEPTKNANTTHTYSHACKMQTHQHSIDSANDGEHVLLHCTRII